MMHSSIMSAINSTDIIMISAAVTLHKRCEMLRMKNDHIIVAYHICI